MFHVVRSDQLYNLQGPVQNENVGSLLKNYEEFQDGGSIKLSIGLF